MTGKRSKQPLPRAVTSGELITDWRLGRLPSPPSRVPLNWELTPIVAAARLESGHTPSRKRPDYWTGSIPWISLHDTKHLDVRELFETQQTISQLGLDNSSARLLPKGTVVFSRTATVGKCTVMGCEMATSQDFANYICGPRLYNHYLVQLFRHMEGEWRRLMAGSTHNTVYMPVFEQLQVLMPPIGEQRKIAAILSSVDEVIEKTVAVIDHLQIVKEAMMQELLTRGLPGRHARFKKTEIGQIPDEWQVERLETLATVERGKFSHRPRNDPRFFGGSVPFIQTGDVAGSGGRIENYTQTLNDEGVKVSRVFPAGTIVITIAANIGDTAIAMFPVAFPDSLVGIRACERIDREFLELVLRTRKEALEQAAPQNAQKNINLETLKPLLIQVPPPDEQLEIARVIATLGERARVETTVLRSCRSLKSALMAVLLTGELRVTPDKDAA
jgi:type I restriction enzyme, S subunit